MELAHWADHKETGLGLTKRAPVPGAEGTQVLTKLRSAPLRFCLLAAPAGQAIILSACTARHA